MNGLLDPCMDVSNSAPQRSSTCESFGHRWCWPEDGGPERGNSRSRDGNEFTQRLAFDGVDAEGIGSWPMVV